MPLIVFAFVYMKTVFSLKQLRLSAFFLSYIHLCTCKAHTSYPWVSELLCIKFASHLVTMCVASLHTPVSFLTSFGPPTSTCTDLNESQSHTHTDTVALLIICCFATHPRVLSHTVTLVPLTSARLWSLLGSLVNLWCDWQLQPVGPRVCILSVKLATGRLQYTTMHLVVRVRVDVFEGSGLFPRCVVRELLFLIFFSASWKRK